MYMYTHIWTFYKAHAPKSTSLCWKIIKCSQIKKIKRKYENHKDYLKHGSSKKNFRLNGFLKIRIPINVEEKSHFIVQGSGWYIFTRARTEKEVMWTEETGRISDQKILKISDLSHISIPPLTYFHEEIVIS